MDPLLSAAVVHTHAHSRSLYTVPLNNCAFLCSALHLISLAAISWWQWPQWELAGLCWDVCNYSVAQKEGQRRRQSWFTVSEAGAFSTVYLMMCTYWLNYQSIVYLCSGEEPDREREHSVKNKKGLDGSAEVQIKANDLVVRRSVEKRWMAPVEAEAGVRLKCRTLFSVKTFSSNAADSHPATKPTDEGEENKVCSWLQYSYFSKMQFSV